MSPTNNKVHKVPPFPFGLYYSKKENARKSTSNFKEAVSRTDEFALENFTAKRSFNLL